MKKESKKILIAEDDLFISEVYFTKLSAEGFEAIIADNGEDALLKSKKENPEVILLDILMPKMDGWDVLKKIREFETEKQKKDNDKAIIIMLTNVGDKEAIEKALKMGADDYLIKSFFTPEEVVGKIRSIIDKNKKEKQ